MLESITREPGRASRDGGRNERPRRGPARQDDVGNQGENERHGASLKFIRSRDAGPPAETPGHLPRRRATCRATCWARGSAPRAHSPARTEEQHRGGKTTPREPRPGTASRARWGGGRVQREKRVLGRGPPRKGQHARAWAHSGGRPLGTTGHRGRKAKGDEAGKQAGGRAR